ncbi:MAG: phosphodiesterase [Calditrichaeota bacterium]|nr:MAG: phosphodiesterase [Calditrichota bacterium]
MLRRGEAPPPEFTRPEVAKILIEGYRRLQKDTGQQIKKQEPEETKSPAIKASGGSRKLLVIGLDCVPPELLFDKFTNDLPNIKYLIEHGIYGELHSCTPPITVPAWASMMSGKDPGQLGIYEFRNRSDYSYEGMSIATSRAVQEERIWDILSDRGKIVTLVGVPQTYPVKPVNGQLVSCFLTPSTLSQYTYPNELKDEIENLVGEYLLDVPNFRSEDKEALLRKIYEMTEKRFRVIRYLMSNKPWDFFMFVEMGTDRIHHAFWKYFDSDHKKYQPGNPFENAIHDYYKYIDSEIGRLMEELDDQTGICLLSDHGAKKLDGGICINEWLIANGYLTLKEKPEGVQPLEKVEIDWSRTLAWGAGGYYGRIFLNVKGREPAGIIEPQDYEATRDELIEKIKTLQDEQGQPLNSRIFKPENVYKNVKNIPPDLIVYFGDLNWRSVASVGLNRIHTLDDELGPDGANHSEHGVFVFYDPRNPGGGQKLQGVDILDIAPTLLHIMKEKIPQDMEGKVILN